MGDRWTGFAAMAAGLTLASIGAVGSLAAPDPAPVREDARAPAPKEAGDRGEKRPRKPRPVETETVVQESPADFYALWVGAFRDGDGAFLFKRLHPTVLDRYGQTACRNFTRQLQVDDFAVEVLRVRPAESFNYSTDGESTFLSSALPVRIRLTSGGRTTIQVAHVAYAGDELRWFTDCGDPL